MSFYLQALANYPEIRNAIYDYVMGDSHLMFSTTSLQYINPYAPLEPGEPVYDHQVIATHFNWQLGSTCRALRNEFLPYLIANTTFWFNGKDAELMDILDRLPDTYKNYARRIAVSGSAALGIDSAALAILPLLENIDFNLEPLEWSPGTVESVDEDFTGVKTNSGLIQYHRDFIQQCFDDQDFFFRDPARIPAAIKLTIGVCFHARIESKVWMLDVRGVKPVPSVDDQDVTFVSSFPPFSPSHSFS